MTDYKKMLALAVFVWMATGCVVYQKNVIKNTADNCMLVEDVITHKERIVELKDDYYTRYLLENSRPGDTVGIKAPGYEETFVIEPGIRNEVWFYSDSIDIRARIKDFELKKQQLFQEKTR